ncbi:MAG: hypothetical protein NDJ89_08770 [Oligoflexia bacterium]|nr:hypothetical protein [Oligoflexia bacterium]
MTKKRTPSSTLTLIALTSLTALSMGACSRERVPGATRIEVPVLDGDDSRSLLGSGRADSEPILPVTSALEKPALKACERLESLVASAASGPRYSLFGALEEGDGEPAAGGVGVQGAIDVTKSPFTQLFLGETFKLDSPDGFFEKARAEYEAGRLSRVKWFALKAARLFPKIFRKLQLDATHEKVAEAFPGIFGEPGAIQGSLYFSLASRSGGLPPESAREAGELREALPVLSADLPLFPGESFEGLAEDARESLGAAVTSLNEDASTVEGRRERLCGLVLWQRSFAQLLTLKGYRVPRLEGRAFPKIEAPEKSGEAERIELGGAFIDPDRDTNIALSAETLQTYDPASGRVLEVTSRTPEGIAGKPVQTRGGAAAQLALLESLVHFYEATSPAGSWFENLDRPVLGNLTAPGSRAILPHEMHSLALGMMVMSFKNVAQFHIVKVNAAGTPLRKGQSAAGIALLDRGASGRQIIPLPSVLSLIRSQVYLDHALSRLAARPASEWAEKSPAYTAELLAKLTGSDASSLRSGLGKLSLPLALLVLQFSSASGECRSELEWNLDTGKRAAQGACDARLDAERREALELLGRHAQAPLLMRRARE